ncbi:MAG: hypothetical protein ACO3CC_19975, partial [Alphaproteobacteria bacterium]
FVLGAYRATAARTGGRVSLERDGNVEGLAVRLGKELAAKAGARKPARGKGMAAKPAKRGGNYR